MKRQNAFLKVKGILYLLFSLTACVNTVSVENGSENQREIPVKLMATVQSGTSTRMAGNSFEEGDKIGLYAMIGSGSLEGERYADNKCFVHSAENEFVPNEVMYYPEDGSDLNLVSYYPYAEQGIAAGESSMSVRVKTDQSNQEDYSASDFLVALQRDVQASENPIKLTYKHRFFRLKLTLNPGDGEDVQQMLAADPKLTICGFFTKSKYDFNEEEYTGFLDEENISPAGKWKVSDGKLVGQEVILIPQDISSRYQYISLKAGGKIYTAFLPSALVLQSGKQQELQITFVSDEEVLLDAISGEIADWENTGMEETESETAHEYINISKLKFENSQVCKVMSGGRQVAEICKEFLVNPEITSQAIVAYPMKDDKTTDLSKGIVMQLIGETGKVHGGAVAWDLEKKTLNYTAGTIAAQNYLSVLADGRIVLSRAASDDVLSLTYLDDVIRDVRGGVINNYPIVKVGTQYWMKSNLEAGSYIDGEQIPSLKEMHEGAVGYIRSDVGNYFYSADVVTTHRMLPKGWEIPVWEDWTLLMSYLNDDVSTLKSGDWKPMKEGTTIAEVNNLSGFSAEPVGMCFGSYNVSEYEGKYLAYWTLDDAGGVPTEVFLLKTDSNEMIKGNTAKDKAYAIRAIRK